MTLTCSCACTQDFDSPRLLETKTRKARKTHICCECGQAIKSGQKYEHIRGLWEKFEEYHTCLGCSRLRDAIGSCEFGGLDNDVWECLGTSIRGDL